MKNFKTYLSILAAIVLINGCSAISEKAAYQKEAEALCDVFNKRSWESTDKNLKAWELQNAINKSIYSVVTSKKMTNILQSLANVAPEDRYTSYIEKTRKLTGQKQDCKNLKSYFGY